MLQPEHRPLPAPIPNHEWLQFVATGGFGEVWLAKESLTGVRRAIKIISKNDAARCQIELDGLRRYQRAAHDHAHLVRILAVGATDEFVFCVMEAADNRLRNVVDAYEAETLRTWLELRGRLDPLAAMDCLASLASAVRVLHHSGSAHNDLKPENVLIVGQQPKIADVGLLGPLSRSYGALGTEHYRTPDGKPNDVFALGKILYELATGCNAEEFPRIPAPVFAHDSHGWPQLHDVIDRACHPEPKSRFASCDEFCEMLENALRQLRKKGWGRRVRFAASMVVLTAAAIGASIETRKVWSGNDEQADSRVRSTFRESALISESPLPLAGFSVCSVAPDDGTERQLHPYVYTDGRGWRPDATYKLAIPTQCEYFCLEAELSFSRPWGCFDLMVSETDRREKAVAAMVRGQPNGEGLCTRLGYFESPFASRETPAARAIHTHPQPGIRSILRLMRLRDRITLAVWNLSEATFEPATCELEFADPTWRARYVLVEAATTDVYSHMQIDRLKWSVLKAPPPDFSPRDWAPNVVGAMREGPLFRPPLPALSPDSAAPEGNLLAPPFHPCGDDAWTPIGNWCWWEGAEADSNKLVFSVPCARSLRELRDNLEWTKNGFQILRFDRGTYDDFDIRAQIILKPSANDSRRNNNALERNFMDESTSGQIGLALRLQDECAPDLVWGGGYVVSVTVPRAEQSDPEVSILRFDGFHFARGVVHGTGSYTLFCGRGLSRGEVLSPDGFQLAVRANGPELTVQCNQHTPIRVCDEGFSKGRLGLFASRLVGLFDSVELRPVEAP